MMFVLVLFWFSFILLSYTYIAYGILLWIYDRFRSKNRYCKSSSYFPPVTLIVPAYNEGSFLQHKINNTLSIDYPKDKLDILFVTDGSTDNSNAIIAAHPQINLVFRQQRQGKMAAINHSMQYVTTPIVVFSDANSLLNKNCIKAIVRHYEDERVGGVAGEKKVDFAEANAGIGLGEGIYWQYESTMKQLDSNFNTVVGAAGELFSIRTDLFQPQPGDTILDDFMLSMQICLKGYKVVYEPNAYAVEAPSKNLTEERKRRVRIAAGAFQSVARLKGLFTSKNQPLLIFQYISRRLLRWIGSPVSLVLLYITNLILFLNTDTSSFYDYFFLLQQVFYATAIVGWLFYKLKVNIGVFFVPFYFLFMNFSLIEGFIKFLKGKQSVLWEKSERKAMSTVD